MKVLVIGGCGYIGSHVAYEFKKLNYDVAVLDDFSSGEIENAPPYINIHPATILNDKKSLMAFEPCFHDVDAIIHLAAFKAAGESMFIPEKYSTNNITGSINVLNAMCDYNVKYIIFSSSAAVYGEPKYTPINEQHPLDPTNYYGFTKLEIERIMEWYSKLKGIKFASLRYFNAAGYDNTKIRNPEKNPNNLLPIIMETITGKRDELQVFGNDYDTRDGTCIRDYVHVNDLAIAHVKALKYIMNNDKNITVNLGTEKGITVLEMLNTTEQLLNTKINYKFGPRRPGDPAILTASYRLAKDLLNWEPQYSDIETLIKTTWDIYK